MALVKVLSVFYMNVSWQWRIDALPHLSYPVGTSLMALTMPVVDGIWIVMEKRCLYVPWMDLCCPSSLGAQSSSMHHNLPPGHRGFISLSLSHTLSLFLLSRDPVASRSASVCFEPPCPFCFTPLNQTSSHVQMWTAGVSYHQETRTIFTGFCIHRLHDDTFCA